MRVAVSLRALLACMGAGWMIREVGVFCPAPICTVWVLGCPYARVGRQLVWGEQVVGGVIRLVRQLGVRRGCGFSEDLQWVYNGSGNLKISRV